MHQRLYRLTCFLCALFAFTVAPQWVFSSTLKVGADVSGAPFEYFQGTSKVPVGFDVDLLQAIGQKMGATPQVVNHQFDDLLAAVKRGEFDAAMSAISDTGKREQLVDFVDYFVAGGGIMVVAGNPNHIFGLDGLCGYSVTVERGTAYEADIETQSKNCTSIGLGPIKISSYDTDDNAYQAFAQGKATAYVADYPVGVYRAREAGGGKQFEVAGRQFNVVPYGIAIAKTNVALRDAIQKGLLAVVQDGTYDKLLAKWGLREGALRVAPINAGRLFEVKPR